MFWWEPRLIVGATFCMVLCDNFHTVIISRICLSKLYRPISFSVSREWIDSVTRSHECLLSLDFPRHIPQFILHNAKVELLHNCHISPYKLFTFFRMIFSDYSAVQALADMQCGGFYRLWVKWSRLGLNSIQILNCPIGPFVTIRWFK